MRVVFTVFFAICFSFSNHVEAQTVPVRVVSYNLLNFPNGRPDCGAGNVNLPNRADTLRKIMNYLKPDILAGCEIQNEAGCDSVLNRSLNVFGTTHYQRAAFVSNSAGGDLQNMLFYNTAKLTLKEQRIIQSYPRDINHYILYVNDVTLAQHHDTCFIEVFIAHLKAGSATADQNARAQQTAALRSVLDTRPQGRHLFVCGDLNTYRSSETCYQNLVSGGSNALRDPLNAPGNWTSNSSFGYLHTQSPRVSGSTDCGVTGGLDDRFDHIIVSQNVINGSNALQYVANSYKAIGNDGNHYNQSILAGSNSLYPDSVVRALYYGSDHLPVKLDLIYTIPTNYGLNLTLNFQPGDCAIGGQSVTVQPNLGQAPYSYTWDSSAGNQTTQTALNLPAGSYCVTVTDQLGQSDIVCFEIQVLNLLEVSSFGGVDDGSCTASIFVVAIGGVQPYSYQWNDSQNQTGATATNLCAGNYICVVTDQNGCSVSQLVTIQSELAAINESFTNSSFQLFPNPTNEIISIQFENYLDLGMVQVSLYSLTGELVQTETIQVSGSTPADISLRNLKQGVYLIELEKDGVIRTQRIIKK